LGWCIGACTDDTGRSGRTVRVRPSPGESTRDRVVDRTLRDRFIASSIRCIASGDSFIASRDRCIASRDRCTASFRYIRGDRRPSLL
jgi:hypothetical protein